MATSFDVTKILEGSKESLDPPAEFSKAPDVKGLDLNAVVAESIKSKNQEINDTANARLKRQGTEPTQSEYAKRQGFPSSTTSEPPLDTSVDDPASMRVGNLATDPRTFFENTSIGSVDRGIMQAMLGIRINQSMGHMPATKNRIGYVFFTRPMMNLQESNISHDRLFYDLLGNDVYSMGRQVRCLLDPRLQWGMVLDSSSDMNATLLRKLAYDPNPLEAAFVEKTSPFINVLSNACINVSGFPDMSSDVHTSKPFLYRNSYMQYDGMSSSVEPITISCTFRNIANNLILMLLRIWQIYGSKVFEDKIMPYVDAIADNWIDTNTRIWRIVTDSSNRRIAGIAATLPAIPETAPQGAFFDYNKEFPYNDQMSEMTFNFKCSGIECFDPILMYEFNETTYAFNREMWPDVIEDNYVKVDGDTAALVDGYAHPLIDLDTSELNWWVKKDVFAYIMNKVRQDGTYSIY